MAKSPLVAEKKERQKRIAVQKTNLLNHITDKEDANITNQTKPKQSSFNQG